jgi:hypothetical protein
LPGTNVCLLRSFTKSLSNLGIKGIGTALKPFSRLSTIPSNVSPGIAFKQVKMFLEDPVAQPANFASF